MSIVRGLHGVWIGVFLVPLLGWFLCSRAPAQAPSKPPAQGGPDKAAEIKTLLKERRDTLDQAVEMLTTQYQAGTVDFARLSQAELDAFKASLELCDAPEERMEALRKYQKTAEGLVQFTDARFKAGTSTQVDVLQAKAVLLEIRVELLREEQKAKPPK